MILICFGTRPEWIKIKPLIDKIKNNVPYKLLYIKQHNDLIDGLTDDYSYISIEIKNSINRLDSIVFSILQNIDEAFANITHTLVQGDTTSAFAVALASFHRNIPIIHLEAGLRSWNNQNPYPEEFNRISISNMAKIHLCPTKLNYKNITNNHSGKAYIVGNTVLDNLKNIKPTISNKILITLHRRENLNIIREWFKAIEELAKDRKDLEFIFPMHPNEQIQKYKNIFKHVKIIKPLSHEECIKMISECGLLITDSGGLQEESAFLKKKSIVCRKTTERQEGEGVFSTLCKNPTKLKDIFNNITIEMINRKCPYGDGNASDKILKILERIYDKH